MPFALFTFAALPTIGNITNENGTKLPAIGWLSGKLESLCLAIIQMKPHEEKQSDSFLYSRHISFLSSR